MRGTWRWAALVGLAGCVAPVPVDLTGDGYETDPVETDTDRGLPFGDDTADTSVPVGPTPLETDTDTGPGLETGDTAGGVPTIAQFRYLTQLGVDASRAMSQFALPPTWFDPALFVELSDAFGNTCEVGYSVVARDLVLATDDPSVDPELVAWLNANGHVAGFAVRAGAYTALPTNCPAQIRFDGTIPVDLHDFFLDPFQLGQQPGYLVGIGPTIGPAMATAMSGAALTPPLPYWSGGSARMPFGIGYTTGVRNTLDMRNLTLVVDDTMAVQPNAYLSAAGAYDAQGLAMGAWLGDSLVLQP